MTFRGNELEQRTLAGVSEPFGKLVGVGSAPCWGNGGPGDANGPSRTYSFRADVLRFLDVDRRYGPAGRQRLPRGRTARSSGSRRPGRQPRRRLPRPDDAAERRSSSTTARTRVERVHRRHVADTMDGFYDASTSAKLTHIVGSGQADKGEHLTYNGTRIARDPFASTAGPGWDNPTFSLDGRPRAAQEITTGVDMDGVANGDCLTWAAVVYRTTVKDGDGDGLARPVGDVRRRHMLDPNGMPLPNLAAMGAQPDRKDLFIELGYMKTGRADDVRRRQTKPAHSHLPSHAALKLVGDMFANAPTGPDQRPLRRRRRTTRRARPTRTSSVAPAWRAAARRSTSRPPSAHRSRAMPRGCASSPRIPGPSAGRPASACCATRCSAPRRSILTAPIPAISRATVRAPLRREPPRHPSTTCCSRTPSACRSPSWRASMPPAHPWPM